MRIFLGLVLLLSTLPHGLLAQQVEHDDVPCGPDPLDIPALIPQAEAGGAMAQYLLGMHFAFGSVQNEDRLTQAVYWFRKSAEQKYPEAEYRLGQAYASGRGVQGDTKTATFWFQVAAEDGSVHAQFWLGLLYEHGRGVTQDHHQALKWFQIAAEEGNPDAQVSLGEAYEYGNGVPQDYAQAAVWYRKAAEHIPDYGGVVEGRNNLGLLSMEGLGTPRDYVEAYKWFSLAGITRNRDEVAKKMAEDQITEGRERAKAWAKDHSLPTKNCLSTTSNSPIRSSRLAR